MSRRRQCASCGAFSSYSAKVCSNPECGKEFVLSAAKPKPEAGAVNCCTPNCPRMGTICTGGQWRCGQCYDEHVNGSAHVHGDGYEVWRKAMDEYRAKKGANA